MAGKLDADAGDYDALVLPGGVADPEELGEGPHDRRHESVS